MNDFYYKNDVIASRISFKHGDVIICILEIDKELNEVGEIIIKEYKVETVLDKIENGAIIQTQSGKKHRHEQNLKNKQDSFDF